MKIWRIMMMKTNVQTWGEHSGEKYKQQGRPEMWRQVETISLSSVISFSSISIDTDFCCLNATITVNASTDSVAPAWHLIISVLNHLLPVIMFLLLPDFLASTKNAQKVVFRVLQCCCLSFLEVPKCTWGSLLTFYTSHNTLIFGDGSKNVLNSSCKYWWLMLARWKRIFEHCDCDAM